MKDSKQISFLTLLDNRKLVIPPTLVLICAFLDHLLRSMYCSFILPLNKKKKNPEAGTWCLGFENEKQHIIFILSEHLRRILFQFFLTLNCTNWQLQRYESSIPAWNREHWRRSSYIKVTNFIVIMFMWHVSSKSSGLYEFCSHFSFHISWKRRGELHLEKD